MSKLESYYVLQPKTVKSKAVSNRLEETNRKFMLKINEQGSRTKICRAGRTMGSAKYKSISFFGLAHT